VKGEVHVIAVGVVLRGIFPNHARQPLFARERRLEQSGGPLDSSRGVAFPALQQRVREPGTPGTKHSQQAGTLAPGRPLDLDISNPGKLPGFDVKDHVGQLVPIIQLRFGMHLGLKVSLGMQKLQESLLSRR
jgi:hypothetical protein